MINQATAQLNIPVELGLVNWNRQYNIAVEKSKVEKKPILILFQEVPGCLNCTKFGKEVLSHPLLVDAIESLFIPLSIFNNNKGEDGKILELFNEPSWNNPVVRIVNDSRTDLAPRLHNNWSLSGLSSSMVYALQNANIEVPEYLQVLVDEFIANENGTEEATFSMHCFWKGESSLGEVDGVISTQAGFMKDKEVVKLNYNPRVIAYKELLKSAKNLNCTDEIFVYNNEQKATAVTFDSGFKISEVETFNIDKEPKYYLYNHALLNKLPLTLTQAKTINARLARNLDFEGLLTKSQLAMLDKIKNNKQIEWENVVEKPFLETYKKVEAQISKLP